MRHILRVPKEGLTLAKLWRGRPAVLVTISCKHWLYLRLFLQFLLLFRIVYRVKTGFLICILMMGVTWWRRKWRQPATREEAIYVSSCQHNSIYNSIAHSCTSIPQLYWREGEYPQLIQTQIHIKWLLKCALKAKLCCADYTRTVNQCMSLHASCLWHELSLINFKWARGSHLHHISNEYDRPYSRPFMHVAFRRCPLCENYEKLYFHAIHLEKGLNSLLWNFWCPFFKKVPKSALFGQCWMVS